MGDLLKKYWWLGLILIVVIIFLPIGLNCVLLRPAIFPFVGNDVAWLSFWGGYLSALVSASIAFIILIIQRIDNKKQSADNKRLQKQIIEYQKNCDSINELKQAYVSCCLAYSRNNIIEIGNAIIKNKAIPSIIKEKIDRVKEANLHFTTVYNKNEETKKLFELIEQTSTKFVNSIFDLQELAQWYRRSIESIDDVIKKKSFKNKQFQEKVEKTFPEDLEDSKEEFIKNMIWYRISLLDENYLSPLQNEVLSFIDNQRERSKDAFMSQ